MVLKLSEDSGINRPRTATKKVKESSVSGVETLLLKLDVEMHLRVKKGVRIKRVRQVVPEIKSLTTEEPEERHLVAKLGTLASKYLLEGL